MHFDIVPCLVETRKRKEAGLGWAVQIELNWVQGPHRFYGTESRILVTVNTEINEKERYRITRTSSGAADLRDVAQSSAKKKVHLASQKEKTWLISLNRIYRGRFNAI